MLKTLLQKIQQEGGEEEQTILNGEIMARRRRITFRTASGLVTFLAKIPRRRR